MDHHPPKKASFGAPTNVIGQKEKISGLIIDTFERVESAFSRLSIVEKQLEIGTTYYHEEQIISEQLKDFDHLLNQKFLPILLSASEIGITMEDQIEIIFYQISVIRSLISILPNSKKPTNIDTFLAPLIEFSKIDFTLGTRKVEKYCYLQSINQFLSTSLLWPIENDPLVYLKKNELEVNELVSGISRSQNPVHLKFADFCENFLKEMINYVIKHFKSGLVWSSSPSVETQSPLQFSIYGHQRILSFSSAPSRTASRSVETKNNWHCEFQGELNKKIEYECKGDKNNCLIFSCLKTHVTIKGKPENVRMENCENVTISLEDVTNSVEITCCRNVEIICTGIITNLTCNFTNGCLIVLNEKNSHNIQIITVSSTKIHTQIIGHKILSIPSKSTLQVKAGKNTQILFK